MVFILLMLYFLHSCVSTINELLFSLSPSNKGGYIHHPPVSNSWACHYNIQTYNL
jgi:hypothetical protein